MIQHHSDGAGDELVEGYSEVEVEQQGNGGDPVVFCRIRGRKFEKRLSCDAVVCRSVARSWERKEEGAEIFEEDAEHQKKTRSPGYYSPGFRARTTHEEGGPYNAKSATH